MDFDSSNKEMARGAGSSQTQGAQAGHRRPANPDTTGIFLSEHFGLMDTGNAGLLAGLVE